MAASRPRARVRESLRRERAQSSSARCWRLGAALRAVGLRPWSQMRKITVSTDERLDDLARAVAALH